jgi:hypothetical protein
MLFVGLAMLMLTANAHAFTSEDGMFTVQFPGQPQHQLKEANGQKQHWFTLQQGGHFYLVMYFDVSSNLANMSPTEVIAAVVKGFVGDNKIVKQRDVTVEGNAEHDLVIHDGKSTIGGRFIVANENIYQVVVSCPGGSIDEAGEKFLDSFKVDSGKE